MLAVRLSSSPQEVLQCPAAPASTEMLYRLVEHSSIKNLLTILLVLRVNGFKPFCSSWIHLVRITSVNLCLEIGTWWCCDEDQATSTPTPPPLFHKHHHAQKARPCQDMLLLCATMF